MTNTKLIGVKIRYEKDKNGKEIDVLETKYQDRERPCKECKRQPRTNGSSRCQECINNFKNFRSKLNRLRRNVELQKGITN